MNTPNDPNSRVILVSIWSAVQEFRNLYEGLKNYTGKNKQKIDIRQLMTAKPVEDILSEQGIDKEAAFTFLTSLERAESDYHRMWSGAEEQERRP